MAWRSDGNSRPLRPSSSMPRVPLQHSATTAALFWAAGGSFATASSPRGRASSAIAPSSTHPLPSIASTRLRRPGSFAPSTATRIRTPRRFSRHLTKVEDALGNQIVYRYEEQNASGYRELMLTGIEYTADPTQSVAAHARVQLVYAPLLSCGNGLPMGAEFDRHFGVPRMTGSRRLTAIETQVKDTATGSPWRSVRRYDLRYDETELACAGSGMRYLERIDQTAYSIEGTATAAAPLTFTYGAKQRALDTAWTAATTRNDGGDVWGPTRMLRDFDGDGWLDELTMETRERCTLAVRPGRASCSSHPMPACVAIRCVAPSGTTASPQPASRSARSRGSWLSEK